MPKYRLTYLPFRARAEVARMLFKLAGQEFEDVVVEMKDWPELKPKTMFGQLPLLEEDGQVICQSGAINRYLARKYGYAGKTEWEQAKVDMVVACGEDFIAPGVRIFVLNMQGNTAQAEAAKKMYAEQIPVFMNNFEKMLGENESPYFVGDNMTWADMAIAEMFSWPKGTAEITVDLTKYPKCKALQEKVHSHPVIVAYQAERWGEK